MIKQASFTAALAGALVVGSALPALASDVSVPLPVNGCKLDVHVTAYVNPQSGNPVYVDGPTAGLNCP